MATHMSSKQKKTSALFLGGLGLLLVAALCFGEEEAQTIEIDVAPNVLNIASSGTVVTVHTDIAYSAVAGASVSLNGE